MRTVAGAHVLIASASFGVAMLAAHPAAAFSADGHRVVEASAYKALRAGPDGLAVLTQLIREGVLEEPVCFEPSKGDEVDECRAAITADPLAWWPIPRTDAPDLVIERQFSNVGQCFHFMGKFADEDGVGYVPPTSKDREAFGRGYASRGLTVDAYERCMDQLDQLLENVVLRDPRDANAKVLGSYAFMHAVADSFSRAHTERNFDVFTREQLVAPPIEYLKVWQPTVSNPFTGSSRITRHEVPDERDDNYVERFLVVNGRQCTAYIDKPYSVPENCLSVEGMFARNALRDAMLMMAALRQRSKVAGVTNWEALEKPEWLAFKDKYLRSVAVKQVKNHPAAAEFRPLGALQLAQAWRPARKEALVGLRWTSLWPQALIGPLLEFGLEVGAKRDYDVQKTVGYGREDVRVGISLGEYVTVGFSPLSIGIFSSDTKHPSLTGTPIEISSQLLQLDFALARHWRLSAFGPLQYNWFGGDRVTWTAGLALGYVYGRELRVGDGRSEQVASHGMSYEPPEPWDVELRRRKGKLSLNVLFGASGMERGSAGTFVTQALEWAYSRRNAWGTLNAVSFGGGVSLDSRQVPRLNEQDVAEGARRESLVSIYATLRAYVLGPLALPVLMLGSGVDFAPLPEEARVVPLHGAAGAAITFGAIDLLVFGPRLDWSWQNSRGGEWFHFFHQGEIISFRIGLRAFEFVRN